MEAPNQQPDTQIKVPLGANEPILALGAELKSTVCLLEGNTATISPDVGHLAEPSHYRRFVGEVQRLTELATRDIGVVAYDSHPEYAASRYGLAKFPGRHLTAVQHHHAHIAACMAENGITGKTVGIACDGTGYGTDGTIWGCEVLLADEASFRRVGHLRQFRLVGGDSAAIETFRPALGLLTETFGADFFESPNAASITSRIDPKTLEITKARLLGGGGQGAGVIAAGAAGAGSGVKTSSLGRLFDAAAFILGICDRNDTEAAAPIALQSAAEQCESADAFPWELHQTANGTTVMDFAPMIREMATSAARENPQVSAMRFHKTIAEMLTACAIQTCAAADVGRVVLSGGCFVNKLLTSLLTDLLRQAGQKVYVHNKLSPGDACVSLGQSIVAAGRLRNLNHGPVAPVAITGNAGGNK
ncbi:MAG: hypothetical protein KAR11_04365 [Phycisphaerae bacterium]|nr:hypothetical protein [Phycisphaerae bacterium]